MSEYSFLKSQKSIKKGEIILDLGNVVCSDSNPARLQVDETTYILPPYYIQHSCSPNSRIDWKTNQLIALRDIKKGDVVSYHYGTSEDDYRVGEFDCNCGSANCIRHFRGFKYMTNIQRQQIEKDISPFLRNKYSS